MLVVVRDRVQGKTLTLVHWMLEGHPIERRGLPPEWSRHIITCHGVREKVRLERLLHRVTFERQEYFAKYNPHQLAALYKSVWCLTDLPHGIRGSILRPANGNAPRVEYAVDDIGELLNIHVTRHIGISPELVTINGKAL